MRFTDAQTERIWAIVSAHQAGLSIRKIAGATGLSSSRIHQLLNAPEAKEIPVWLSQLRQSSGGYAPKKEAERPEPETKIPCRLPREVEALRRCIDWLQRLERGENVIVNLRLDTDVEPFSSCSLMLDRTSLWLAVLADIGATLIVIANALGLLRT